MSRPAHSTWHHERVEDELAQLQLVQQRKQEPHSKAISSPKKETLAFSHSIIEKATFGFSLIPPLLNTTCSLSLVDFNFTHTHMHAHTHTPYAFNYYYSLFINIKAWVKLSFWHCPPMPLKSISFAHID